MVALTLRQKQSIFVKLVAQLIDKAYAMGYELTFGEAFRTPEQAALNAKNGSGIANSLHTQKLAIDLNLYINGIYQTDSMAHKPLGEYWESLSTPDYTCAWGGRFKPRPDGNHYSLVHNGLR